MEYKDTWSRYQGALRKFAQKIFETKTYYLRDVSYDISALTNCILEVIPLPHPLKHCVWLHHHVFRRRQLCKRILHKVVFWLCQTHFMCYTAVCLIFYNQKATFRWTTKDRAEMLANRRWGKGSGFLIWECLTAKWCSWKLFYTFVTIGTDPGFVETKSMRASAEFGWLSQGKKMEERMRSPGSWDNQNNEISSIFMITNKCGKKRIQIKKSNILSKEMEG